MGKEARPVKWSECGNFTSVPTTQGGTNKKHDAPLPTPPPTHFKMDMLSARYRRVDLDVTKYYMEVKCVDGVYNTKYVGRFVRVFRMGSGDGMSVHMEFDDNGRRTFIDEEMWGSLYGDELSYFIEVDSKM